MRSYAVVNHKGGAGKTTTAVHAAWALANRGWRVLIADLDPQGALATYFRLTPRYTLYHTAWEGVAPDKAVVPVGANLDALLADGTLAQLELYLADRPRRESAVAEVMARVGPYDAVLFDCPPSLSLIIVNAFYAADALIAPVQMELLSFKGVLQTLEYAQFMGRYLQYQPEFFGVVPTMYREDNPWHRHWLERTREGMPEAKLLEAIPFDPAIPDGLNRGMTAFDVSEDSPAARAYTHLAQGLASELEAATSSSSSVGAQ